MAGNEPRSEIDMEQFVFRFPPVPFADTLGNEVQCRGLAAAPRAVKAEDVAVSRVHVDLLRAGDRDVAYGAFAMRRPPNAAQFAAGGTSYT